MTERVFFIASITMFVWGVFGAVVGLGYLPAVKGTPHWSWWVVFSCLSVALVAIPLFVTACAMEISKPNQDYKAGGLQVLQDGAREFGHNDPKHMESDADITQWFKNSEAAWK